MTTVLVLGLGASGLAMARWSARQGASVRVWDSRAEPPQAGELAGHVPAATRLSLAALTVDDLAGVDRVLKSPGLAPHDKGIATLLAAAAKAGIPVHGELDLFAEALESLRTQSDYAPKVVAVTGTNGKTTTTAMTALLAERSGKRVAVAGNIGPTMLQTLADAIDAGPAETLRERLPEVWVLELSSFQLADSSRFEADAAALLNLSEDHLDWHGSMATYAEAKARVFGKHAIVVIGRDDAAAMRLVPPPETVAATRKGRAVRIVPRRVVTFGAHAPERPGDWGLVVDNDMTWLARARDDDASPRDLTMQPLMPADALRVRGRHNALNALAALALASAIGCPLAPMLHALREYRGEPHRVEIVATVDGVDAFDDSKGTNVGATVAALDGLGADRAPAKIVVILGGDGKGQDFAPLAAPLQRHARAVLTIGRDAARIEKVLAKAGIAFERCATLEGAVEAAFAEAERGDAVLLSPACASLDMFRNYAHRAEVFVAAVRAVALSKGEVA
jgi:UDP-N-acetylmuramoylalanine--D-glutamate ligase